MLIATLLPPACIYREESIHKCVSFLNLPCWGGCGFPLSRVTALYHLENNLSVGKPPSFPVYLLPSTTEIPSPSPPPPGTMTCSIRGVFPIPGCALAAGCAASCLWSRVWGGTSPYRNAYWPYWTLLELIERLEAQLKFPSFPQVETLVWGPWTGIPSIYPAQFSCSLLVNGILMVVEWPEVVSGQV